MPKNVISKSRRTATAKKAEHALKTQKKSSKKAPARKYAPSRGNAKAAIIKVPFGNEE